MTLIVHSIEEEPAPNTREPGADATEGSGTSVDLHRDVAEDDATAGEPNLAGTLPDTAQATSDAAASSGGRRKTRTSNRTGATHKAGTPDKGTTAQGGPRDIPDATQYADAPKMKAAKSALPPSTSNKRPTVPIKAKTTKPALTPSPKTPSKSETILKLLKRKRGATLAELVEATGWQGHSVRGFLSGTVRKKLGLPLVSEKGADGVLRYRIAAEPK